MDLAQHGSGQRRVGHRHVSRRQRYRGSDQRAVRQRLLRGAPGQSRISATVGNRQAKCSIYGGLHYMSDHPGLCPSHQPAPNGLKAAHATVQQERPTWMTAGSSTSSPPIARKCVSPRSKVVCFDAPMHHSLPPMLRLASQLRRRRHPRPLLPTTQPWPPSSGTLTRRWRGGPRASTGPTRHKVKRTSNRPTASLSSVSLCRVCLSLKLAMQVGISFGGPISQPLCDKPARSLIA